MQSKFSSTVFAFVCGALVVAIAFGVGLSVANMRSASAAEPAQASPQQWEYKTVIVESSMWGPFGIASGEIGAYTEAGDNSNGETFSYLRDLGKDGWELVCLAHNTDESDAVMIFKRPLG